MLFSSLLKHGVRHGAVRVVDARGRARVYGDGSPPRCTVRLRKPGMEAALALNAPLRVPEAYMDGDLTIEDGTLFDFIELAALNYKSVESFPIAAALKRLFGARPRQRNPLARARANVAHHYDLSTELYELFLDHDRQYSCAYFTDPNQSIDVAQDNKKRHLASKLLLKPDMSVLDIGSGWGGLAMYLAEVAGADVTGVTLSVEQHRVANERAAEAGLGDRARFRLQDYRHETRKYDRIVSVGMFEHVGKRNYPEFFAKVRDLLADDGVAVLHSIGRLDEPAPINPFIRKYIFPGADVPSLSEVLPVVERSGLLVTDVEVLRLHYAETLKAWRERFNRVRSKVAAIYDERFCRMWELYLVICEMGFRHLGMMVFQMQLAKRLETVPTTRDYMFDWERRQSRLRSVRGLEATG
jgi:cyclopropane-fatty-acyl-phospholipid synthase